ncbi:methyltransferase domain-containing protein [Nocardia sp. NPDC051832]|uniref:class I SAM-dependent methyltransferase n=1 Tax=Nocardia sp. NPDC051832 TaxID=3155673 RepID=UPI00343ED0B4
MRRRYDRIAPFYQFFMASMSVTPSMRRRAVQRLKLQPGQTVVEIGCGSGAHLGMLATAVGPEGTVIGVDISPGMLARARQLAEKRGWRNVTLVEDDAMNPTAFDHMDGVFFGLSYAIIPDPRAALRQAWARLAPGGRIVISEGHLPQRLRRLRPFIQTMSRATVLGDVERRPWEDLAELTDGVETERLRGGLYVITVAQKPAST